MVALTWSVGGSVGDGYRYGYDADGNRLYRRNTVDNTFSELYAYDQLGQLTSFQRGTRRMAIAHRFFSSASYPSQDSISSLILVVPHCPPG